MNFIAIDFETANSQRSSICSMGVAVVRNGALVHTNHIYIKPTPNYYDGYNTVLHGIDDSHTRHKGTFHQQWAELKPYFHNQTVIAHNASFDFSVLRFTLDHSGLAYPDLDYHCTYRLAQQALPLVSHKLNVVSRHFGRLGVNGGLVSDAKASALIALKLCEQYKVSSLAALSAQLGFKTGKIMSANQSYKAFSKK